MPKGLTWASMITDDAPTGTTRAPLDSFSP
jgi:hypothetical protein